MSTSVIVATVVAVVVVLVVIAAAAFRRRANSRQLQQHFGDEYERMMVTSGDRRTAEQVLSDRVGQRDKIDLTALSDTDRDLFQQEWRQIQEEFVDEPGDSLARADELLNRVLRARGYPVEDFNRQADLISVDHPQLVGHYREAHAVKEADGSDRVTTEHVRRALVAYRALFAELLDAPGDHPAEANRR